MAARFLHPSLSLKISHLTGPHLLPASPARLRLHLSRATGGDNGSTDASNTLVNGSPTAADDNTTAATTSSPPPQPRTTLNIKYRRRSRNQARRQEQQSVRKPPPKKEWEAMSLSEKAVELYVGEKGLLFWLNKFAYASIFIIVGGWILFRFVGPSLGLYQLDSAPLPPSSIFKGST
ncbi:hypothetical protein Cni_G21926 [Canna indica]|uniref:Uncharacterized protein n=1 Tax=Canna indica TaxID=4628 RepID=A0AAQ3KWW9_9LILI|nr:hypothetical protein Cni_G21926 [Canna indica]